MAQGSVSLATCLLSVGLWLAPVLAGAGPRVIVISLDGAKPDLVERYLLTGALDDDTGIGRIAKQGVRALQNVTATPSVTATLYSLPNFDGAHGHDSELRSMSAILYAAGPHVKRGILGRGNIDVAPTVLELLGVAAAPTIDGRVIGGLVQRRR